MAVTFAFAVDKKPPVAMTQERRGAIEALGRIAHLYSPSRNVRHA
ncbi:hypothetical protein ACN28E_29535 [Archangium lansingense]